MPAISTPHKTTRGWPPARRARQATNARHNKPWLHATGPRTVAGKAKAAQNGLLKDEYRLALAEFNKALKRQRNFCGG